MVDPDKSKKTNHSNRKPRSSTTPPNPPPGDGARVSRARAGKNGFAREPAVGPRRQPGQKRSRQMVQDILQAAAEVFARLGYARATTNKIAERAGVSVGSLYQYFPNKDSLLARLLAQHHEDVHRVIDRSLDRLGDSSVPLEHGLRMLLTELMALHQADPALTRALSSAVLRQSPAIDETRKDRQEAGLDSRVVTLLEARPDVRDGDFDAMAAVLGQTTSQLTRWLVHDAPPHVDRSALLEETVQLLTRYLQRG